MRNRRQIAFPLLSWQQRAEASRYGDIEFARELQLQPRTGGDLRKAS